MVDGLLEVLLTGYASMAVAMVFFLVPTFVVATFVIAGVAVKSIAVAAYKGVAKLTELEGAAMIAWKAFFALGSLATVALALVLECAPLTIAFAGFGAGVCLEAWLNCVMGGG